MDQVKYNKVYRKLIRRFIGTSILLLSIVFAKQLITSHQTEVAADASYVINIAGRQRMLSQKIVKDILLIEQDQLDIEENAYRKDLKESFEVWTPTHEELLEISKENVVYQKNSKVLEELFSDVAPNYLAMVEEVQSIITGLENNLEETEEFKASVLEVVKQEELFLEKMDRIVSKYEKRARSSIYVIERTHRLLFLFIILTLVFITMQIFKPLFNYLEKAHLKVIESNKNLVKIIQFMKGSFFLTDLEGNILFMNEDAETLLAQEDIPQEKLSLVTSIQWIHFDVEELIEQARVEGNRIEGLEAMIEDKEGNLISVMLSAFASYYNNKQVIVFNLFDFTVQKRAEELLKETVVKDELTGLYNRHVLERILEKEFKKADLYEIPLSAILLDLDNFKKINDECGHPVGDAVLQLTAETIKSNIRNSDYAIRIGGEEILIFMPNTDKKSAVIVAEKIRNKLGTLVHPEAGKVTASFGVVERQPKEEYLFLYKRVDQALYEAKEAGKNRVKVG